MNRVIGYLAVGVVSAFLALEVGLLYNYWSLIWSSSALDKVGPLLSAMFAPVVSVLTILFSYIVINRQFRLNEDIEKIKHRLGERYKRESDAYFRLWNAVSASYRQLAVLETATTAYGVSDEVEAKFREAEPYSFVMPDDENTLFYSYWQKAREIAAKANNSQDAQEIQKAWSDNVREFGNALNRLRDIYRRHYLLEPDEAGA